MKIWLFQIGESYPFQKTFRQMRTDALATVLASRGHSVVWWGSTFHHPTKTLLYESCKEIQLSKAYSIRLIKAIPYQRNISLKRYWGCIRIAQQFRQMVDKYERPDVVIAAMPDYHLAYEVIRFTKKYKICSLIDIRDIWPDTFLASVPTSLRGLAKLALRHDYNCTKFALENANSLVSISNEYLEWGLQKAGREKRDSDRVFYFGYSKPEQPPLHLKHNKKFLSVLESLKAKTVFTFVGTFGHSYDLLTIISAARKLMERNINDIHFVLAGDGVFNNIVRKEAADLENVSFVGWLNKYEIELLLNASDVGLVTYKENATQSLSYKPFEYLAFGLPIFSSLKGELSQLIRNYEIGVTYKAENEDDFIKWVLEIKKNKLWKNKLSSNAVHTFQTVFNSGIIYNAYADYIEQIYNQNTFRSSCPMNDARASHHN